MLMICRTSRGGQGWRMEEGALTTWGWHLTRGPAGQRSRPVALRSGLVTMAPPGEDSPGRILPGTDRPTLLLAALLGSCGSAGGERALVRGAGPDEIVKLRAGPGLRCGIVPGVSDRTPVVSPDGVTELRPLWGRRCLVAKPWVRGFVSADQLSGSWGRAASERRSGRHPAPARREPERPRMRRPSGAGRDAPLPPRRRPRARCHISKLGLSAPGSGRAGRMPRRKCLRR